MIESVITFKASPRIGLDIVRRNHQNPRADRAARKRKSTAAPKVKRTVRCKRLILPY